LETSTSAPNETWNLADIFPDSRRFEEARRDFRETLPTLDRRRGRLAESAPTLLDALEQITEAARRFALLRCYSSLKADEDVRIDRYQAMRQEIELLATEFSGKIAFLRPEILAMKPETVERFIEEEAGLAPHAHFLHDLMRQRTHVLGPAEERIMAETSLLTRSASSLFNVLNNVELPRPAVQLDSGERVRLTPVEFQKHRVSQHRPDRQRIFPEYYRAFSGFKDTLGSNLYSAVKANLFRARVRRYDSCLTAALDPDNVPVEVYRNLIRQVHGRLDLLHRYFRIRSRVLGLELGYPDLYCPLSSEPPRSYSTREANRLVTESLEPLGPDYVAALRGAFDDRWIDWHPGEGKRSGAYATGWAYDVHPYVLMNYISDYESVSTLAHEMGHAMHSHFSNKHQPYATADYSVFVAEVASTLNEALLIQLMLRRASEADEKRFLLGSYLEGIRGTLFRQTMFAEFELEIHERVERGEVLTGEILNSLYVELLRKYNGHDEGVVTVDEDYAVEWAAIPHMYYNFYVYQYATGIVAATALAEALLSGDPQAQQRYLGFLGAGGSDHPLELLREAGVDLESAEPYEATFRAIERSLDQLDGLLGSS